MIKKEKYEEYKNRLHQLISVDNITDSLFILRIERKGLKFLPGQFIVIGIPGATTKREYSIYSGVEDAYLEIIVREVPEGDLSPQLKCLKPGDELVVDGPAGDFILPEDYENKNFLFLASGTGISPFHSFLASNKKLKHSLYHGVRTSSDLPLGVGFEKNNYMSCMSAEDSGDYFGYLTKYIKEHPVSGFDAVYMCGNGNMVYDAFNILISQGISRDNLHAEIFF